MALLNILSALSTLAGGAAAPMRLGSVTLVGAETPSRLERAGKMQTVTHRLVGGGKIINVMGPDPGVRSWAGILNGPNALARVQAIEALRDTGQPVVLTVLGFRELVLVQEFTPSLQSSGYVIPYTLVAEVIPQRAQQAPGGTSALSSLLGSGVASAVTSVSSTVQSVTTFAEGAIAQVDAVAAQVAPIANLVGAGGALAGVENNLALASSLTTGVSNIAAAPAGLANLAASLGSSASNLMSMSATANGALSGFGQGAGALSGTAAAAGAAATAAQAGGYVNQAASNIAIVTPTSGPVTVTPADANYNALTAAFNEPAFHS